MALPVLLAAPQALAGDDGANAFAYRLPALAIALLALAAVVLVLTGVLLRTGALQLAAPAAWAGAAFLLVGAVPLTWAVYRQLRPVDEAGTRTRLIDEDTARARGVRFGELRRSVVRSLGAAAPGSSIAPLGEDFDEIGGPPFVATPGSSHESLRYRDTTVLLSDGRTYGFVITAAGAETLAGVGVGDNLDVAKDAYPGLECGIARAGEYRTFPYCSGRLGPRRWLWFGQDPIRSIVLTSTELGAR